MFFDSKELILKQEEFVEQRDAQFPIIFFESNSKDLERVYPQKFSTQCTRISSLRFLFDESTTPPRALESRNP